MGLISPNIFYYIELADGFSIVEISEVTFLLEKHFMNWISGPVTDVTVLPSNWKMARSTLYRQRAMSSTKGICLW
jgi:hypothetical protein